MKQLRQKLHSKTGASMLLALLFLFFCLMVGTVVLTAASANAGRLARNRTDQQRLLAAQSAALLLRADLEPLRLEVSYVAVEEVTSSWWPRYDAEGQPVTDVDGNQIYDSATSTDKWYETTALDTLSGSQLTGLGSMESDFRSLFLGTRGLSYRNETIEKPASMAYALTVDAAREMPQTTAKMAVTTDPQGLFTLAVTVQAEGGSTVTLTAAAQPAQIVTTTQESSSTAESGETTTTIRTTRVTHTALVQWDEAEIRKGGPT